MENEELINMIKNAFYIHFPDSYCMANPHILNNGFSIHFVLGLSKEDWPNGYMENDPLRLVLNYWLENQPPCIEIKGGFSLAPEQKYFYSTTRKIRAKTILFKNFDSKTFEDYFKKLKEQLISEQANWHTNYTALMQRKLLQRIPTN